MLSIGMMFSNICGTMDGRRITPPKKMKMKMKHLKGKQKSKKGEKEKTRILSALAAALCKLVSTDRERPKR